MCCGPTGKGCGYPSERWWSQGCLEAGEHCTSSHSPRAEGDDLFLEMLTQFLSLQRGWGVCLRAGPPALPQCRGQRNGAPHLLSAASRDTSTPTASSPMTRGSSPCRWVQEGASPTPGGASGLAVGRMQLCGARAARPLPSGVAPACGLFSARAAGCGRFAATPARGNQRLPLQSTAHPDTVPCCHTEPAPWCLSLPP